LRLAAGFEAWAAFFFAEVVALATDAVARVAA